MKSENDTEGRLTGDEALRRKYIKKRSTPSPPTDPKKAEDMHDLSVLECAVAFLCLLQHNFNMNLKSVLCSVLAVYRR